MATKHWQGYKPDTFESVLATHPDGWDLYLVRTRASSKMGSTWLNLKLVAQGKKPNKANYSFAYCVTESRYAENNEIEKMQTHQPALFEWVSDAVERHVKKAHGDLTAPAMPTATEKQGSAPSTKQTAKDWPETVYKRLLMATADHPRNFPRLTREVRLAAIADLPEDYSKTELGFKMQERDYVRFSGTELVLNRFPEPKKPALEDLF